MTNEPEPLGRHELLAFIIHNLIAIELRLGLAVGGYRHIVAYRASSRPAFDTRGYVEV